MAIERGLGAPRVVGGESSIQKTSGFVTIQTAGARELAQELARVAGVLELPGLLKKITFQASKPIRDDYKILVSRPFSAKSGGATGNLAKSVKTISKDYRDGQVGVSITGPRSTGNKGADERDGSGNHAWLVEFGTGRRRPGTQGRRTYVNVHQAINGKMKRTGTLNDEEFARKGRGYYFLMGSINEPTRQAGRGKGYSHDFALDDNGKQHPITLGPGESIDPMPAYHPMEDTITANHKEVQDILFAAIQVQLSRYT
jgi:hypothetical protein